MSVNSVVYLSHQAHYQRGNCPLHPVFVILPLDNISSAYDEHASS